MSPLVVFILFFVFLLIAIQSLYPLVWLQYYQEYLIRLLQQVLPTLSVLCLVESTVSHSLQYRCLFYPVLLWQEVEFLRDYLISFHISLKTYSRSAMCSSNNLSVLWSNLWFRNCHSCRSWQYDDSSVSRAWLR